LGLGGDTLLYENQRSQCPARKITAVKKGPISSLVVIEVAPGVKLTASVTADAVKELKLTKGKPTYAIVKAPSVIVGID
jgi:molybdopterin-binding protein